MDKPTDLSPATLAAQALGWIDEPTCAVVLPLHTATTYIRDPDNQYRSGYSYTRDTNPTYTQVETLLATLDRGSAAAVFASGMAAATAVFQALKPGDHVLAPRVMYWGLRRWLETYARTWGLEVEFFANNDLDDLKARLRPGQTTLVWLETPANPLWDVTDIRAVADLAHAAGARVAVDSTAATPVLSQPLTLGADIVMHSATKYLNGHSDVLAGALVTAQADDFWARLLFIRKDGGAMLGPFETWLLLRGMRTLYVRVQRICASAQWLAEELDRTPGISAVLYPGLPSHPGHAIAARQMSGGFGGMLSMRVAGGTEAAIAVAAKVKLWKRATSLGGVESLIEHRASVEGPASPVPGDLLRLSVGIEDPADLLADLRQALAG